jgi:hypothetical protein
MSDLWKLREWLEVGDAAEYLTVELGSPVSVADVLRMGLEGRLELSVDLPAGADAKCWDGVPPPAEPRRRRIDGLWTLSMIGAGRLQVEHDYRYLRGLPFIEMDGKTGAFVERTGLRCQLPAAQGYTGLTVRTNSAIPHDSMIVVTRAALDAFVASRAADRLDRPLRERERANLLTIIAALAKAKGIDISKSSTAGKEIESLTIDLGARVPARSIEEYLKKIPDATERRAKTSG